MPIVRVDVPEGHSRQALVLLKRSLEASIARTWAREHIYVALYEMLTEPGDRTVIMTVDLRPGRGRELERAKMLYREALSALQETLDVEADRFVLLVREFPEWAFVVDGGKALPPLGQITPELSQGAA